MDGPSASWRVVTGDPVGIITREAAVHDLVVLAGPSSASGGSAALEVDGVLLATGRPTLLAAGAPDAGDSVLVGWNRSLQSGRALTEGLPFRSEEHTSELQSLMRISYAVFCLKKKKQKNTQEKITEKNEYRSIVQMNIYKALLE